MGLIKKFIRMKFDLGQLYKVRNDEIYVNSTVSINTSIVYGGLGFFSLGCFQATESRVFSIIWKIESTTLFSK